MEDSRIDKPRSDAPKKSEAEQLGFFDRSLERYREAAANKIEIRRYFDIGGTKVCLVFAGDVMIPYLTPAIIHLEITEPVEPDLEIFVWDSKSTNVEMVLPPCDRAHFTERGDFWGFNSKRIRAAFHWSDFSVNLMDLDRNIGIYWVKTVEYLPMWVFAAPMRTMFHWWMEKNGCQLLHAAAVGTDDGAVLITGKGGSGKSTTALACLRNGMYYLADDYLIVKPGQIPVVISLYCTAKLLHEDLRRFPEFERFVKKGNESDYEKLLFFLYPDLKSQIIKELPLKAVIKPEITDSHNSSLSGIPFSKIHGALSFTTMSQLPHAGEYTQKIITGLIRELPCYLLSLGQDTDKVSKLLKNYLAGEIQPSSIEQLDVDKPVRPLISVIVPVYNGGRFVHDAVKTIKEQNYPALEIIFVNDGSIDNSEEVIKSLDIDYRYFFQENQGPAVARNKGIKEATAAFIAFLDVDDLWPENNLNYLMDELLAEDDCLVVHGYAQHTEKNSKTGIYEYVGNPEESFPGYLGAGLYRREAFSAVGIFDTLFAYTGEDADWFKRASELEINLKKLEEVTLFVRRHGENMTDGRTLVELNVLKVFKKSLDRVRNPYTEKIRTLDVSVIIPVFNGEKYIAEAINSVLSQDIAHTEVILVDDGSTDNTVKIAERFVPLIRIVKQENMGAAAARNTGIGESCGRYLSFLDADDLWTHWHTEALFQAIEDNPEYDMVIGELEQFISPELETTHSHLLRKELKVMPGYHPGCMLIKTESFKIAGMFNEKLELAETVDWFARADQAGLNILHVKELVYKRRIHDRNQGLTKKQHIVEYTQVLREKLIRDRKGNQ